MDWYTLPHKITLRLVTYNLEKNNTVNPLYNIIHYNSKILYNIILTFINALYCYKFTFLQTKNKICLTSTY